VDQYGSLSPLGVRQWFVIKMTILSYWRWCKSARNCCIKLKCQWGLGLYTYHCPNPNPSS